MSSAQLGARPRNDATTMPARLRALGRAELTLLLRNRTALFTALGIPVLITFACSSATSNMDLKGTGLTAGTVMVPASIGFVMLFAVYSNLVGTYVVRREELVLKRLRTGEPRDAEILAGAALPLIVVALVQCVLLLAGGAVVMDLAAPEAPVLVAAGVLLGLVLSVVTAAVTAAFTSTAEAAQITPMPLMMVSFLLSAVLVPLEVFPDMLADAAGFLPFTPIMELVRGGWTGTLQGVDVLRTIAVALAWTALAGWVVRRRFRWEPRR